jgi:hypothetical protein
MINNYFNSLFFFCNKDKPTIRESAFTLFGRLSKFSNSTSKDSYLEQIHSNLINFILHLNEQDETVRSSCNKLLLEISPLLNSPRLDEYLKANLAKRFDYEDLIDEVSKIFVRKF